MLKFPFDVRNQISVSGHSVREEGLSGSGVAISNCCTCRNPFKRPLFSSRIIDSS
jgi:hypothetical protein